jgi:hypothetical protein
MTNPISERLQLARTAPSPYEDRYLAFIDILGWKELVYRSSSDPKAMGAISEAAEVISMAPGWAQEINDNFRNLAATEAGARVARESGEPFDSDIRATHFSDNFVLSAPVRQTSRICLPYVVASLVNRLTHAGIYTRGSIVRGLIRHADHAIFGPALVDAYELERDVANYPRILVHPSAEGLFDTPLWLRTDTDGLVYFNALRARGDDQSTLEWLQGLLVTATTREGDTSRNLKLRAKTHWMKAYLERTISEITPH